MIVKDESMKVKAIKDELKQLSADELRAKIEAIRQELFSYRLNSATAHIKDYSQFKKNRAHIARGLTYLRQKQSGL